MGAIDCPLRYMHEADLLRLQAWLLTHINRVKELRAELRKPSRRRSGYNGRLWAYKTQLTFVRDELRRRNIQI